MERSTSSRIEIESVADPVIPPTLSPQVRDALDSLVALSAWLREHQAEECDPSRRSNTATVLFALCIEHREAILLLLTAGCRSSAYALVRSCFEAYMRGMWVLHVASNDELTWFSERDQAPSLERIVRRLGQKFATGIFVKVKSSNWQAMCDYAHGGGRQVSRWLTGENIAPAHPDEEVLEILRFVDYYSLLALFGVNETTQKNLQQIADKGEQLISRWEAPPVIDA